MPVACISVAVLKGSVSVDVAYAANLCEDGILVVEGHLGWELDDFRGERSRYLHHLFRIKIHVFYAHNTVLSYCSEDILFKLAKGLGCSLEQKKGRPKFA
jgi:hypothetical protein